MSEGGLGQRGEGGTTEAFSGPMWDGGEGWEEAVDMPSHVTYVAEEHVFFVERSLAHLPLGVLAHLAPGVGRGAAVGVGEGSMEAGGVEG